MILLIIGLFVYATGLCLGSFLNVVIYRLPLGISVAQPTWSFCPRCNSTIKWYDNIPVASWLMLGARCRNCRQPISVQYPLVEAITGLAFVLTFHLLFVQGARVGATALTWPTDVPLLLAWLTLVAAMIACSGMDLVMYIIDTRITDFALFAGIVLYALWPHPPAFAHVSSQPLALGLVVAGIISILMLWFGPRHELPPDGEDAASVEPSTEAETATTEAPRKSDFAAAVPALIIFVLLAFWLLASSTESAPAWLGSASFGYATLFSLTAMFAAMVLAGGQTREADQDLHDAIEAEAPAARGVALRELLWLTPAILGGVGAYVLALKVPAVGDAWTTISTWTPWSDWMPVGGAAFAVHGAVVGAGLGWLVRIFFTLVFGREAFGTGDIFILAAAGAVGWDIAVMGFLLSVLIALVGWILGLLLKRTGMIPLGPPLALGFLVALWINRPAALRAELYYHDLRLAWEKRPELLWFGIGFLMVALPDFRRPGPTRPPPDRAERRASRIRSTPPRQRLDLFQRNCGMPLLRAVLFCAADHCTA